MSPNVLQPSVEQLRANRERLSQRLGMSRPDLEARADAGTLTGEQFSLYEDVVSIEFLLGDVAYGRH